MKGTLNDGIFLQEGNNLRLNVPSQQKEWPTKNWGEVGKLKNHH